MNTEDQIRRANLLIQTRIEIIGYLERAFTNKAGRLEYPDTHEQYEKMQKATVGIVGLTDMKIYDPFDNEDFDQTLVANIPLEFLDHAMQLILAKIEDELRTLGVEFTDPTYKNEKPLPPSTNI